MGFINNNENRKAPALFLKCASYANDKTTFHIYVVYLCITPIKHSLERVKVWVILIVVYLCNSVYFHYVVTQWLCMPCDLFH